MSDDDPTRDELDPIRDEPHLRELRRPVGGRLSAEARAETRRRLIQELLHGEARELLEAGHSDAWVMRATGLSLGTIRRLRRSL